jgi:hypothetical protein
MTVTKNTDGSVTVSLMQTIQVEGNDVTGLTLKQPTGKHWRKLDFERLRKDGGHMADMIGQLAAVPPSGIDQLTWPDLAVLSKVVMDFFEPTQPSGGTQPRL